MYVPRGDVERTPSAQVARRWTVLAGAGKLRRGTRAASMSNLEFLAGHELVVYSETHCPDCVRLKQWMSRRGVKAREVLISDDTEAAEKLERETGKMAVPFILVDGTRWVRGYHQELPTRFSESTLLEELRAATER